MTIASLVVPTRAASVARLTPAVHGHRAAGVATRTMVCLKTSGWKSVMLTAGNPANAVGAIANEAGLEGRHIGQVDIRDDHSFVDLPEGMPKDIFRSLKKVRVVGQELRISRADKPPR